MKSEESTGDKEEDEDDGDTSDFHLDQRFLGTTDTMASRFKKTRKKRPTFRFKMHFYPARGRNARPEGQKSDFWTKNRNFGPKKNSLLGAHHVLATTGKSCSKKKSAFAQIIKGGNVILGDFLG